MHAFGFNGIQQQFWIFIGIYLNLGRRFTGLVQTSRTGITNLNEQRDITSEIRGPQTRLIRITEATGQKIGTLEKFKA